MIEPFIRVERFSSERPMATFTFTCSKSFWNFWISRRLCAMIFVFCA